MLKIAVLISGRGSNLRSLLDAQKAGQLGPAEIVGVLSNKPDAPGLAFAREAGIETFVVAHRAFESRQAFEEAMDAKLASWGVQLVCLAGFMRLLTPWFVSRWQDRLINIHPSLLPSFPGLDTHQKAIDYGARFGGCTVHFVRAEMDHGPIILQAAVPIAQGDDEAALAARVLAFEHRLYPEAVRLIAEGLVNVHDERCFIAGAATPDGIVNPSFAP